MTDVNKYTVCLDSFSRQSAPPGEPSSLAPATAEALTAALSDFRTRANACATWQEALGLAANLDQFRVAVELWGRPAG